MERFISVPDLPEGRVSAVILGHGWPHVAAALRRRGIKVYELPENKAVAPPVAGHADLSAYYCGGGALIVGSRFAEELAAMAPDLTIYAAQNRQGSVYPADISLNACRVGDILFCREADTDPAILHHAKKEKLRIIDVKQGYARCSVCILDERHVITADPAIADAAKKQGIEVLCIHPGFFELPGYDYGFIGGSCFKSDRHTITFTGALSGHEDENRIYDFIKHSGYNVDILTDDVCVDIGSVIPIKEII